MKKKIWRYFRTSNYAHGSSIEMRAKELVTGLQDWEKENPGYVPTGRFFSLVDPSSIDDRFNDFCLAVEYELAESFYDF
jgi:hypothetical protein